jgi:glyoxylase-like metal-dependent hydrolase (beta-lactamase superfamily II)
VVLIKSPGHTPGSQLIYVALEDGTELLILGDTAWHLASIEEVKSPPKLVSLAFLHNDRRAHICHLDALHKLAAADPKIQLIPGHDGEVIAKLVASGTLHEKFE